MAQRTVQSGDESRRAVQEAAQRARQEVHKESAGLMERIGVLEIELQKARTNFRTQQTELEGKLARVEADNQRLRRMATNQRGKQGFDDVAHAAFNELNVPVVDMPQQRAVAQIKQTAQVCSPSWCAHACLRAWAPCPPRCCVMEHGVVTLLTLARACVESQCVIIGL